MIHCSTGPEVKRGVRRWIRARGFIKNWNPVRGPGKVEVPFTEKAVFLLNLEKKEYVHVTDKRIKGRKDQQNSNLVITTITANTY